MEKREHDLFLDMASNQQATIDDLIVAGVNASNTALQDRSAYKLDEWVRSLFQDQYGNFDEVSFDAFYNNAKIQYNSLADADYNESMKRLATYHRSNIFAPIELRRSGPDYLEFQTPNPYLITSSLIELGREGERQKSIDELAQANKVLLNPTTAGENLENAEWGDTPNDSFWGYFTDTLVLALYDEKGTHKDPFTGQIVEHNAGDLKVDNTGNFYYEKLDGRDIYGRRVLNKMNVITTDGSFANQYDFFDSDDLNQKSIGGSIMKNLALVGTMFIPYIGPWIRGISIASQMTGLLGTLGKMFTGSDSPTFSAMEGWSKSVNRQNASTEYAQEHTWCWENFINLIGDVIGLLAELRFIFEKIPYVFKGGDLSTISGLAKKLESLMSKLKKLNNIKIDLLRKAGALEEAFAAKITLNTAKVLKALANMLLDKLVKGYNTIGEVLGKGYMTAITVGDTYGEAKQAGASDLDATLLTLGYAAGEYAILNTSIGEWIMPELRSSRYRMEAIAKALTKLDNETKQNALQTAREAFTKISTKEGKKAYVKKLFNVGKLLARDVYTAEKANGTRTMQATFASAMGEGVEEVSEEVLADFSKGCYDVVKWLLGEDTRLNTFGYDFTTDKWNKSEVVDRYGMSLVGGFLGGGITNAAINYKTIKSYGEITNTEAIQLLVYMSRNGQMKDFMKLVNKMLLGDKNMSVNYEIINKTPIFEPGTATDNLDVAIKQIILNLVNIIQGILSANGAVSDNKFLDIQTLNDIRFAALTKSTTAGLYLQTYNSLLSDIVRLTDALNTKLNEALDINLDGVTTDKEKQLASLQLSINKETVKSLLDEIKEKKKQLLDLLSGKSAVNFIATALYEITPALSGIFTTPTFPLFAEYKYKKKYSELTEDDKLKALEEYKNWKSTEGRELLYTLALIYLNIVLQASNTIKAQEKIYLETSADLINLNSAISNFYKIANIHGIPVDISKLIDANLYLGASLVAANSAFEGTNRIYDKATNDYSDELTLATNTIVNLLATDELKANVYNIEQLIAQVKTPEEKKLLLETLINALDDILINNVPQLVQPLIDRGFANAETKNLLVQLLLLAHSRAMIKETNWEQAFDEGKILDTDINPYVDVRRSIKKIMNAVDKLNATPLELNLNEFAVSIGRDPVNLTLLINNFNSIFNDTAGNVSEFTLSDQLLKDLNNAIRTLQMYQSAIQGARTDNANVNNPFGYNATLNEVSAKVEGAPKLELAEIDKTVADVFVEDIKANLNKLEFLRRLYDVNLGLKLNKLDRVATKKDLLIYKRLRNIVDVRKDDDPIKKWEGFLDLQTAVNNMTTHKELLDANKTVVDNKLKEQFEKEKLDSENAIYEFFLKNIKKLDDPELLAEFLNPNRFLLYSESNELLNEGLENLDDNSIVWWLASRAGLKAQDFYYLYQQIIDPNAAHPLAPIATLELAIYNNYVAVINGNIFTKFYEAYRHAIKKDWKNKSVEQRKQILRLLGKSETFSDPLLEDLALSNIMVPRYSNIILTEGAPGTGKTASVILTTLKLLQTFHPKFLKNISFVHGANTNSAIKLRDDTGFNPANSKVYDRTTFMQELSKEWKEYSKDPKTDEYKIPDSDYIFTDEGEFRSSLEINSATNVPSLIVIDEASRFSAYDMDLIDKYARKYGITVLLAGDFDLIGIVGTLNVTKSKEYTALATKLNNVLKYNIELSRINFISSPKLGVSMRSSNLLMSLGLLIFLAYTQNPTGLVELPYYEDETGLFGNKVILYGGEGMDIGTILEEVDKMVKTKGNDKIGFIYSDKQSPLYAALESKYKDVIDFKEGGTAQGLEGLYYIIEADTNISKKEYLRLIYTGLSRAQLGSLIIAPITYNQTTIKSRQVDNKIDEPLPVDTIKQFAQKRKDLLKLIVPNGEVLEIIPRTAETKSSTPASNLPPSGLNSPVATYEQVKAKYLLKIRNAKSSIELYGIMLDILQYDPKLSNDLDIKVALAQISRTFAPSSPVTKTYEDERIDLINAIKLAPDVESIDKLITEANLRQLGLDADPLVIEAKKDRIIQLKPDDTVRDSPVALSDLLEGRAIDSAGYFLHAVAAAFPAITEKIEAIRKSIPDYILGSKPLDYAASNHVSILLIRDLVQDTYGDTTILDAMLLYANGFVPAEGQIIEQALLNLKARTNLVPEYLNEETESDEDVDTDYHDVINEEDYKKDLDDASLSPIIPTSTFTVKPDKPIEIDMLLHTFNSYELGVAIDENGMPISHGSLQWMNSRIDSINGLMKIDRILNKPIRTVEEYKLLLGKLRNILFNTADKSLIEDKIRELLELSKIYCTFALKSSPRIDRNNLEKLTDGYIGRPTPFCKNVNDNTILNGSTDTRSSEWHLKSIVAIIGTEENKNVLELPLIALSSPFTILLTKKFRTDFAEMLVAYNEFRSNPNIALAIINSTLQSAPKNSELYYNASKLNEYLNSKPKSVDLYHTALYLVLQFSNNAKYLELVNLFRLYTFTDAGIRYIKDPQFTPVRNFLTIGSVFSTKKGYYQEVSGLEMNDTTNTEAEWLTLEEFSKNPLIAMTKIMVSKTGTVDGLNGQLIVNSGHPFVLVSYNTSLKNDELIILLYINQLKDPNTRKEVSLIYVLPPKASIDEYLNNLRNILTGQKSEVKLIGNIFTSYRLLSILMLNSEIRNSLEHKSPGLVKAIDDAIQLLDRNSNNVDKQRDILQKPFDWSNILFFGLTTLTRLLDSAIARIAYNYKTIDGFDLIPNVNNSQLMKDILANLDKPITGVYYRVKIKKNAVHNGYFYTPYDDYESETGVNPLKIFHIHGKLDSYTFKSPMNWIVNSFLNSVKYSNGRRFTLDSLSYMLWDKIALVGYPGYSNLNPPVNPQAAKNERIILNTINYVKSKLGLDITDMFKNQSIQEAHKQIVEYINSENNLVMAFTIGDKLLISNKSEDIQSTVNLYDNESNPITDISKLANNNGLYKFKISAIIKGKLITTNAVYDINDNTVEIEGDSLKSVTFTPSVTLETFDTYITTARKLLEKIFVDGTDPMLEEAFAVDTYEEFISELLSMPYLGELRTDDINSLEPQTELEKLIILDILNNEEAINPDNENPCLPIKLIF